MRKVHLIALGVSLAVSWASTPAAAIEVIWTSANTTVQLDPGEPLEFENPLTGGEAVGGYKILEWLDADYNAPADYEDWDNCGTGTPDGSTDTTQVYLRNDGMALCTTSTVPSTIVSIHLDGDYNDGLADVEVDGVLVAQLDMHTDSGEPGDEGGAFILVEDLSNGTHTIEVIDQGQSVNGDPGDTDVHIRGAAVLGGQGVTCKGPSCPTHGQVVHFNPKAPGQCYQMPQDSPVREDFTDNLDALVPPWHWETKLNAGGSGMTVGMIFHCYGTTLAGILALPPGTNVQFDIHCPESPETGYHRFGIYASQTLPDFKLDTSITEDTEGLPHDDVVPAEWSVSDVATVLAMDHVAMGLPIGACCLPDGCIEVLEAECEFVGGDWCGPGTACDDGHCSQGICIPTLSEWGMVVMLLLVVAAGTIVIRRRRTVVA